MKYLFDQNISYRILKYLPERYAGSSHVKTEGLINSPDKEIWKFARNNGFLIVTQDSDFNDLNSLLGFPPKIIWIRTGNLRTDTLIRTLIDYEQNIQNFLDDDHYGCFEIIKVHC